MNNQDMKRYANVQIKIIKYHSPSSILAKMINASTIHGKQGCRNKWVEKTATLLEYSLAMSIEI